MVNKRTLLCLVSVLGLPGSAMSSVAKLQGPRYHAQKGSLDLRAYRLTDRELEQALPSTDTEEFGQQFTAILVGVINSRNTNVWLTSEDIFGVTAHIFEQDALYNPGVVTIPGRGKVTMLVLFVEKKTYSSNFKITLHGQGGNRNVTFDVKLKKR